MASIHIDGRVIDILLCWIVSLFVGPSLPLVRLGQLLHHADKRIVGIMKVYIVCASCSSWVKFDSSGCTKAVMSRGACAFTCKWCREVARLVGEVGYIRHMIDSVKRMITGQGLEEESGETGYQVASLGVTEEKEKGERVMTPGNNSNEESRNGKETAERSSSEDRGPDIEIEGERDTEEEETGRQLWDRKGIPPCTQMLATHSYKRKPDGPVGNELDVKEGDTLVYLMKHDDKAHWWLAEDERNRWDT